jgi:hypothetical protein
MVGFGGTAPTSRPARIGCTIFSGAEQSTGKPPCGRTICVSNRAARFRRVSLVDQAELIRPSDVTKMPRPGSPALEVGAKDPTRPVSGRQPLHVSGRRLRASSRATDRPSSTTCPVRGLVQAVSLATPAPFAHCPHPHRPLLRPPCGPPAPPWRAAALVHRPIPASLARHKTTPRNPLASSRVLRSRRRPRLAQRLRHSPLTALIIWALGPSVTAPLYSRCVSTGSDGEAPKGSPAAPRPEAH